MLDQTIVDSLLSEVPSEVFDAIAPLGNRNNQAVFIALIKNNKMRFGELKELFKVKNSEEVNHPLKSLVNAGIVSRKIDTDNIGNNEIAVYCPSFMGKSVMRSIYKGVMLGENNIPSHPKMNFSKGNFTGYPAIVPENPISGEQSTNYYGINKLAEIKPTQSGKVG